MTTIDAPSTAPASVVSASADRRLRWGSGIMAAAGLGFIAYAVIFLSATSPTRSSRLGLATTSRRRQGRHPEFSPALYHYISHLHIAVSGFIAAAGLATAALAWFGVRRGQVWAWVAAVATPVLGLAVALPAHYPNDFDTLGHLG